MNAMIDVDSILASVREHLVMEKGHKVTVWDRIPLFKGSLVELTFNFTDGPVCNWQDIVPVGTSWFTYKYDPERRNDERAQDGALHGKGVHATVADRKGLTLSANARLDTSTANGCVGLGSDLWDTLRANGFRFATSYAQWKKMDPDALSQQERVLQQYSTESQRLRGLVAAKISELESQHGGLVTNKLLREKGVHPDQVKALKYKTQQILGQLPVRKGWFRAIFLHEAHPAWTEYNLVNQVVTSMRMCTPADVEQGEGVEEKAVHRLMEKLWGKVVVWNNPSTRTNNSSTDLSRWPKIAIQLMNEPKKLGGNGRESATLTVKDNCLQIV